MGTNREQTQSQPRHGRLDEPFEEPVFETRYEYGGQTDGLTVVLIDAIADVKGISPADVAPKITESVDPDAMERVLRPLPDGTERNGRLTFYLLDFRITVSSDGMVRVFAGDQ